MKRRGHARASAAGHGHRGRGRYLHRRGPRYSPRAPQQEYVLTAAGSSLCAAGAPPAPTAATSMQTQRAVSLAPTEAGTGRRAYRGARGTC